MSNGRPNWPESHECSDEATEQRLAFLRWYEAEEIKDPAALIYALDSVADEATSRALRAVASLLTRQEPCDHWDEAEILEWLEDQA